MIKPKLGDNLPDDKAAASAGPELTQSDPGPGKTEASEKVATQQRSRSKGGLAWFSGVFSDNDEPSDSRGGSNSPRHTVRVDPQQRKMEKGKDEYMDPRLAVPPRAKDSSDDSPADEAYKSHDHSGYVKRLKDSAIAQIDLSKDCDLAMLCRDNITEEWWLLLFSRKGKSFSSSSYAWDSVTETWDRAAPASDRPISEWDAHMKYLASSKDCRTLRGTK